MEWQILLILVALGIASAALLAGAFRKLRLWRLVARTPTTPAGAVAPGPVEVCGTVEAEGPLERAPFSGTEAAYGTWSVEELRKSGKSQKWVVVEQGRLGGAFRVRDASGAIRVDPDGADEDVEPTWNGDSSFGRDPPPQVASFLQARGISFEGLFGANKRMRYRERLLVPGAQAYVLGIAAHDPSFRMAVGSGEGRFPFVVSSKPELRVLREARNAGLGALVGGLVALGAAVFILLQSGILG